MYPIKCKKVSRSSNANKQTPHVSNKLSSFQIIQCVSVDSTSFVIYPELEETEIRFSALKRCLSSFYFRIDNETGRIQRNTLYIYINV